MYNDMLKYPGLPLISHLLDKAELRIEGRSLNEVTNSLAKYLEEINLSDFVNWAKMFESL